MRASKLEFEHRFWIICGIYFFGFALSIFDQTGSIAMLRQLFGIPAGSTEARMFSRTVIGTGAGLVFLAAALRTWAAAYLRTSIVHDTAQHSEALVADGPFRCTRNPLYLANLPMAIGIGVLASRLGFIFLVAANWIFVYRLIFREEETLRETLGESYLAYCRFVPRFWPSLRARVPAGNRRPRWGQAFAGESFVWIFALAELSIALTLNSRVGLAIFGIAFFAYLLPMQIVRRRRERVR